MPEHTEPEKPLKATEPDEEAEEEMEEEVKEGVLKHLEKLYKAIGELTEATKAIASYVKASEEVTRGLFEALKGDLAGIRADLEKLEAGFSAAASAHKEQDKFPTTGKPKVSETAEQVNYPPSELRERGAEMLEKKREEFVKSVVAPRPTGANPNMGTDKVTEIVKAILAGNVKPGQVAELLKEVRRG
jgi:hypothetical protein